MSLSTWNTARRGLVYERLFDIADALEVHVGELLEILVIW